MKLANCEERAEKSETFELPDAISRMGLQVGDFAKLIFEDIHERMWVKVTDRKPGGTYAGVLDNKPLQPTDELYLGAPVEFAYYHIANTMEDGDGCD